MATPAMATPILAPSLNTQMSMIGTLNVTVMNNQTPCYISFSGKITQMGTSTTPGEITFTSNPLIGCTGFSVQGPVILKTTFPTSWTFSQFKLNTPFGQCDFMNSTISYTNPTRKMYANTSAGICQNLLIESEMGANVYF
ncbi:MAG: hypothetical protein V4564_25785 [Pseudomonadota bacterium]|uniref:hypothetical protein n=1 Tax=Sphingomonas sp. ERG5 TaxID=1381597 RepID=UPI00136491A6|nr:hypothetical protein [Sphingomonas sp. ERG5]